MAGEQVSPQRVAEIRRTWASRTHDPSVAKWDWGAFPELSLPVLFSILPPRRGEKVKLDTLDDYDKWKCTFRRTRQCVTVDTGFSCEVGIETKIECEGVVLEHIFEPSGLKGHINLLRPSRPWAEPGKAKC